MKTKIWFIEDDDSLWEYQKETILDELPDAKVEFFQFAGDAIQATGSPDFIVIDVGAIMGLGCDIVSLNKCNIEGLSELHPGAIFVINSAIGAYAEDIWEELKPECQALSRWCGCDIRDDICRVIKEYL